MHLGMRSTIAARPRRRRRTLLALALQLSAGACGGRLQQVRADPAALARYLDECWRQGDEARSTSCSLDLWRVAEKWIAFEEDYGKWTTGSWRECNDDPQSARCRAAAAMFDDMETAAAAGASWRWCKVNRASPSCGEFPLIVEELRTLCRQAPESFACDSRFAADLIDWGKLSRADGPPRAAAAQDGDGCRLTVVTNERPSSLPRSPRFLFKGLESEGGQPAALLLADYFEARLALPPGAVLATMKDIEALVALEMKKDLLGCDDVACMAEIAGALGADFVLGGAIGQVGGTSLVSVRIVDTRSGAAKKTVVEYTGDACRNAAVARAAAIALAGAE